MPSWVGRLWIFKATVPTWDGMPGAWPRQRVHRLPSDLVVATCCLGPWGVDPTDRRPFEAMEESR
jgi:hypothetical protein